MPFPPRLYVIAACALFVWLTAAGCASPIKAYAGPDLPRERLAIVRNNDRRSGVSVVAVDGRPVGNNAAPAVHMLPGQHRLEVRYQKEAMQGLRVGSWSSVNFTTFRHDFAAGREYGFVSGRERQSKQSATLDISLVDQATSCVVAEPSLETEPPTFRPGQQGATVVGVADDGHFNAAGREVWLVEDAAAVRQWLKWINEDQRYLMNHEKKRPATKTFRKTLGYGAGQFEFVDVPPDKYLAIFPTMFGLRATAFEVAEGQRLTPPVKVQDVLGRPWFDAF